VPWRLNLYLLCLATSVSGAGLTFHSPLMPLFVRQDIGIHNVRSVAVVSGAAISISGFSAAAGAPLWGTMADRLGRKPLVLRAIAGAAITATLTGLVRNVTELLGARALLGFSAGINRAANAMVASQAPHEKLSLALGRIAASRAVGLALGPVVAGVLATVLPTRTVFIIGGLIIATTFLPVALFLQEVPNQARARSPALPWRAVRAVGPAGSRAIAPVLVCQGVMQFAYTSNQQLTAVRLLVLDPQHAAILTGLAFAVMGLCTALAAALHSTVLCRFSFRATVAGAALTMALLVLLAAMLKSSWPLAAVTAPIGMAFGSAVPALSTMLAMESPDAVRASIFGVSSALVMLGSGFAPICAGLAAAAVGLEPAMLLAAAAALTVLMLLWRWAREPVPAELAAAPQAAS
jgi:MFS transporter, DHA1 family, multidrug resistance protein